jgi:DNA (cytosine-5)-methyltransferase 1
MEPLNELALFFGGGGGLLASQIIGHRVVCGVEIDPFCREVIIRRQEERYLSPFPIWDDATTFDGRPWYGVVDIITAGFPCQPWSLAGKRRGIADERNLWPCTFRIIQEVRPKFIMLENVPGIRKYLPVVIRDLRRAKYTVERPIIIAAAAMGAGHIRKRIWILAHDESQCKRKQTDETFSISSRQETRKSFGCMSSRSSTQISSDYNSMRKLESEGELKQEWRRDCDNDWWESEPRLARLVCRPANRVERIRITGNIQVPAVAALAWKILMKRVNNGQ